MSTWYELLKGYPLVLYGLIFLFGMCLGSFASALSYRVPRRMPWSHYKDKHTQKWVAVRSICPECKNVLGVKDLFPLLSWGISKGRCRYCQTAISVRYPIQEVIAGVVACVIFYMLEDISPIWALACILSVPFIMAQAISVIWHKFWSWGMVLIISFIYVSAFLFSL